MFAAARITDPSSHPGGTVGGPSPPLVHSTLIEGLTAAVMGDAHVCSTPTPPGHLNSSVLIEGSARVRIAGHPAARVNDHAACGAQIVSGATRVRIG